MLSSEPASQWILVNDSVSLDELFRKYSNELSTVFEDSINLSDCRKVEKGDEEKAQQVGGTDEKNIDNHTPWITADYTLMTSTAQRSNLYH